MYQGKKEILANTNFTPLRILNAQSNRSMSLITARKAGVLNVQWCIISPTKQLFIVILSGKNRRHKN
jgi:hypothetical protein